MVDCAECGKELYVEDGTRLMADGATLLARYDERRPHALEHLSSEARGVAGLLASSDVPRSVVVEVVRSFCRECGEFTRHAPCGCGRTR